jgi:hypothetical protein
MASMKELLTVLHEAGVEFSFRPGAVEWLMAVAERRGIRLESEDEAALMRFQEPAAIKPDFLVNVMYHPQLAIPARRPRPDKPQKPQARPLPKNGLPPWGQMEERLIAAKDTLIIPIDWWINEGELPRPEDWDLWVDHIVERIDYLLWPECKPGDDCVPDRDDIVALMDADFSLLDDLHDNLQLPIPSEYPTQVFHNELFDEEDDGSTPFGTNYERYDPTLSARILHGLPDIISAGMADKVGTLDLQLKQRFQRPRAHQVAFLQRRTNYNYRWARTANTPSLVSGHCLQASIGGCTAYVALASDLSGNTKSLTSLAQLTVDIGDRRNYAGVHYPSDNLASWYVAFQLIPHVFSGEEQKLNPALFLWLAISQRSDVFRAIKGYKKSGGGESPYAKMLAEIEKMGKEAEARGGPDGGKILTRLFSINKRLRES